MIPCPFGVTVPMVWAAWSPKVAIEELEQAAIAIIEGLSA
jgi:hypothetical protein